MIRSSHFWSVLLLLSGAAGILVYRGDSDHVPPSTPLSSFPVVLNGLTSTDQPLAQETLDILGDGIFLSRVYSPPGSNGNDPQAVGLFIAYFPTQRTGQSIHSPQNCLPGAGWTFVDHQMVTLPNSNPANPPHQASDFLISDGTHQAEVLYWYKTETHWTGNDWLAKGYVLLDSMRYGRTDAALIRVTSAVRNGEDRAAARQRVMDFAATIEPMISKYVPD